MSIRRFSAPLMIVAVCAVALAGCCPAGPVVLRTLTLPPDASAGCTLVPPSEVTDGPLVPMTENPFSTAMSERGDLIAGAIANAPMEGVKYGYAAVYECGSGGPRVRVYAVIFRRPASPDRVAALEAAGAVFKGQLAGRVVADEDACRECYDAAMSRALMVLGK
jgi:hypothetical protein